jgi:ATP-dependent DNA ligase
MSFTWTLASGASSPSSGRCSRLELVKTIDGSLCVGNDLCNRQGPHDARNERDHVRFSAASESDPKPILASPCHTKLEGIIAKRANAPYVLSRTSDWLKLKCKKRQEFVIVGSQDRMGATAQMGV